MKCLAGFKVLHICCFCIFVFFLWHKKWNVKLHGYKRKWINASVWYSSPKGLKVCVLGRSVICYNSVILQYESSGLHHCLRRSWVHFVGYRCCPDLHFHSFSLVVLISFSLNAKTKKWFHFCFTQNLLNYLSVHHPSIHPSHKWGWYISLTSEDQLSHQ